MQISKKTLATVLIGLAALISIASVFCFFGATVKFTQGNISLDGPTMFAAMFGGSWTVGEITAAAKVQAGLVVVFVIEMLIVLIAIALIAGNISKKMKENTSICLVCVIALLALVAAIMSFCTKSIMNVNESGVKLGAGAISYGVLGIISFVLNVLGIILYKKAK